MAFYGRTLLCLSLKYIKAYLQKMSLCTGIFSSLSLLPFCDIDHTFPMTLIKIM